MNVILNKNVDETKLKTIKTKQEKGGGWGEVGGGGGHQ